MSQEGSFSTAHQWQFRIPVLAHVCVSGLRTAIVVAQFVYQSMKTKYHICPMLLHVA